MILIESINHLSDDGRQSILVHLSGTKEPFIADITYLDKNGVSVTVLAESVAFAKRSSKGGSNYLDLEYKAIATPFEKEEVKTWHSIEVEVDKDTVNRYFRLDGYSIMDPLIGFLRFSATKK